MARVYVSIGSNIEPERHVRAALAALAERFDELTVSTVYESVAVGFEGDNFHNLVVGFDTDDGVREVAAALREIEAAHRRERGSRKFAPRTLDLDLILYGDLILKEEGLELPRGELSRYAFMLQPLAEIAPDGRHPESGQSFREMWQRFEGERALWPVSGGSDPQVG